MKIKFVLAIRKIRKTSRLLTVLMILVILFNAAGCLTYKNQKANPVNNIINLASSSLNINQITTAPSNDTFKLQNEFTEPTPTNVPNTKNPDKMEKPKIVATSPTPTISAKKKEKKCSVTLLAVGDNLIHTQIINSGKRPNGSYNYDHLYKLIKGKISSADIAVVNQETILGGSSLTYSGYPNFNSPTQIGDSLITAGFDVILHATNHTMDKGLLGVKRSYAYWNKHPGIKVLGINMTKQQRDNIPIIKKNGIKIAMLNYTYGLNGYRNPKNMPYLVNMLDKNQIRKDIMKAKKKADFIIVFPHWGTEYVYKPSLQQNEMTKFFYDLGVDLVIGSHPHVIEPVKWIKTKKKHKMLVYYSLGNFVSYQIEAPRMLGGIAEVTITKAEKGTYISNAGITPIITHYQVGTVNQHYGIYELSKYNKKLASSHSVSRFSTQGPLTYKGTYNLAKQVLGSWFKEY